MTQPILVEVGKNGIYLTIPQPTLRNIAEAAMSVLDYLLPPLLVMNILLAIPQIRKYVAKIISSIVDPFIYYRALIMRDEALDSFDCIRAYHYYLAGKILRERGRYEESLTYFVDARNDLRELSTLGLNVDPISNVGCEVNIALALSDQGNFESAKKVLEKAVTTLDKFYGENSIHAAKVFNSYAIALKNNGELDESAIFYNRALEIYEAIDGCGSEIAKICSNLSLVLAKQGNLQEALKVCQRALDLKLDDELIGPDDISTAITYNNQGTILRLMGNLDESLKCHQLALGIKEMDSEKNALSIAQSCIDIASILDDKSQIKAAVLFAQRAFSIRKQILGSEDYLVIYTEQRIRCLEQKA